GVPLLLAMLLINPIQLTLSEFHGLGGPYPLFTGTRNLVHAWFLAFLLIMCWMLFVALTAAPARTNSTLRFLGRWTLRNSWTLALTSLALGALSVLLVRVNVALALPAAF